MAWGIGEACPKPVKGSDWITRRRKREAEARRFRNAVWKREMAKSEDGYAYCQACGVGPLKRTRDVLDRLAGHVAHDRGRRVAPEDKYNPDAATLKCAICHLRSHGQRWA